MSHYTTEQRILLAEYLHGRLSNAGAVWHATLKATTAKFTQYGETKTFYPYDYDQPVQQHSINRC